MNPTAAHRLTRRSSRVPGLHGSRDLDDTSRRSPRGFRPVDFASTAVSRAIAGEALLRGRIAARSMERGNEVRNASVSYRIS